MLPLPRTMIRSYACRAICTLSPLDAALTMQFAKTHNTTRLKCCACHAKWTWTRPKCCTCHEKWKSSSENLAKVTGAQNDFRHHLQTRENVTKSHACHAKRWNLFGNQPFEKQRFCSFPHRHGDATRRDMLEPRNEHFVRDVLKFFHFVATESMFSNEFSHERQNLLPQNRCFVPSFRQFSSHAAKCYGCHGICALAPLDVLPQKTAFDTLRNMLECHKTQRLPRETRLRDVWNLQKWPLLQNSQQARPYCPHVDHCGRLRTVADANATPSEHTLNPHTPRVKWEPLLRIQENSTLLQILLHL